MSSDSEKNNVDIYLLSRRLEALHNLAYLLRMEATQPSKVLSYLDVMDEILGDIGKCLTNGRIVHTLLAAIAGLAWNTSELLKM